MPPAVATARDGTRLAYALHGQGTNGVVLIHSLAMDRGFWQPVAERLAGHAPVLVYDCRGHGESDKPAGPYTVELFARDLADLLDHVGWTSALVAGASMGGCIALAFAAAYPARTAALGSSTPPPGTAPRRRSSGPSAVHARRRRGWRRWSSSRRRAGSATNFAPGEPQVVQHSVDVFLRNDVQAYVETCRMLGAADLRAALPAMTMPTAIVVGEEDYATPVAMAEAMHRSIEGSTLTVLKARVTSRRSKCPMPLPES